MNTPVPSFLDGSSSFLQVKRTIIKDWTSLSFGKIPLLNVELAVVEHLKNQGRIL